MFNAIEQAEATVLRALIVGGGTSAQVAAQSLADMGVDVTFARLSDIPSKVYISLPGPNVGEAMKEISTDLEGVQIIDVDRAPAVRRAEGRFRAVFQDATESCFECLFVAPGVALRPKPAALPETAELFDSRTEIQPGERVAFLTDCLSPSDPALTMAAIKMAAQNVLDGGQSLVCFKHVAVAHLFGESLYDWARNAGVQFLRYGSEMPTIFTDGQGGGSARFRLKARDLIDSEEESVFDCDRVMAVTGPDASSIPQWAVEMADGDRDDEGFLLSESIHCHSGGSFAGGVFVVGEATGSLDLITCVAQAKAAAAKAKAWMSGFDLTAKAEPISVSTACARCLTCHRVCPHKAMSVKPEPSRPRVEPWPLWCRECGICASSCPAVAIRMAKYPEDVMISRVREIGPAALEQTTVVFGCQRSAGLLAESIRVPEHVQFFAVPCAGWVSEHVIWSTLSAGAGGVLVVGCHHGNCASNTGTDRAAARIRRGLDTGLFRQGRPRLGYATIAPNEAARFERLLSRFAAGQTSADAGTDYSACHK